MLVERGGVSGQVFYSELSRSMQVVGNCCGTDLAGGKLASEFCIRSRRIAYNSFLSFEIFSQKMAFHLVFLGDCP